jgi:hypothetical protein
MDVDPSDMQVDEVVMASMLIALDQGITSADDIKSFVLINLKNYGHDLIRGMTVLNQMLSETHPSAEYVMGLGGDFVMSGRGREVINMAKRKLDVNELIGESKIDLDEEDVERIKGASENLPG